MTAKAATALSLYPSPPDGDGESFKQTDLGAIPTDWDVVPLTKVGESLNGLTYSPRDVSSDGTLVLRSSNVQNGRLCFNDNVFVQMDVPERAFVKSGDILICVRNGSRELIGKCARIDSTADGMAFGAFMGVFRSDLNAFLFPVFESELFRQQVREHLGATINQITNKSLNGFLVPLPRTEKERRAIAEALSDASALIESLESLIAKKRAIKDGVAQELLSGTRRLPGFQGNDPGVRDQYGSHPRSWCIRHLVDVVDPGRQIRYGIVQPGHYDPQGRFMIRGQDYSLAKGWAHPSDIFRVSDAIEARYRNARVRSGDLIITIVGYCGHVEMVPLWLDGANLTQTTARVAIHPSKANALFCKYLMRSSYVQNQVAAYLKGNAQPGLNCSDVEKFRLPLPSDEEQALIAGVLSDLDQDVDAIHIRLIKARQTKQAMMQELLTGRVRLL